jgi:hypothetical protein
VSEENHAALGLVAVFGAAAVATKLEGVIELGIALGVAFLLALRQSRRRAVLLAGAAAVALVGLVPWRVWAMLAEAPSTYPTSSIVDNVIEVEPNRVPIASLLLLRQLFDPEVWLVLVPLALLAVVGAALGVQRRRLPAVVGSAAVLVVIGIAAAFVIPPSSYPWRTGYWLLLLPATLAGGVFVLASARVGRDAAYVGCAVGGMFAALVVIYLFTPYDFAWHLGTSSSRVVLPLGLFAAAFAPIVLARAVGSGSRGRVP